MEEDRVCSLSVVAVHVEAQQKHLLLHVFGLLTVSLTVSVATRLMSGMTQRPVASRA